MRPRIDILLASYNGAKFIGYQLDSIIAQWDSHIRLLIRDDGSTDGTSAIIAQYALQYPHIITILPTDCNVGATQNFNILLQHADADFIFFSDQDDIWEKDKISLTLQSFTPDIATPQMCFTDLCKIDEAGNIINTSLYRHENINPLYTNTHRLLMQNVPYGCTMAINKSLAEVIKSIPSEALLHDHWIALISSLFGEIHYLPTATIRHRIHDTNASRAASVHRKEQDPSWRSKLRNDNFNNYLRKLCLQAEALLRNYESRLTEAQKLLLQDFVRLAQQHGITRKYNLLKNRFFKHSFKTNIITILRA